MRDFPYKTPKPVGRFSCSFPILSRVLGLAFAAPLLYVEANCFCAHLIGHKWHYFLAFSSAD